MTAWTDSNKIGYISLQEYEETTLALENTSIRKGLLCNDFGLLVELPFRVSS